MQFLQDTTPEALVGQTVTVILRSNSDTFDTISARVFLNQDQLFIDCVPALAGKYTVAVPDDAVIALADSPDKFSKYGILIHPQSEAGSFIKSLLVAKIVGNN